MVSPTWGSAPGYPAPPAKRGLSTRAIVAIIVGSLALVLVIILVVTGFLVFGKGLVRLKVPGAAMEPTIRAGQTISANKVDPGEYKPKRGDIVVFAAPPAWSAEENQNLIKRVIGLPGERLACCDPQGRWTIGGTPLDEPYVKADSASDRTQFDILVPEGRLWVMGDNRPMSNDSRNIFKVTREIQTATIPVSAVSAVVKT